MDRYASSLWASNEVYLFDSSIKLFTADWPEQNYFSKHTIEIQVLNKQFKSNYLEYCATEAISLMQELPPFL